MPETDIGSLIRPAVLNSKAVSSGFFRTKPKRVVLRINFFNGEHINTYRFNVLRGILKGKWDARGVYNFSG
jgi:hypothetical protein